VSLLADVAGAERKAVTEAVVYLRMRQVVDERAKKAVGLTAVVVQLIDVYAGPAVEGCHQPSGSHMNP
jgi:hypothetical protein